MQFMNQTVNIELILWACLLSFQVIVCVWLDVYRTSVNFVYYSILDMESRSNTSRAPNPPVENRDHSTQQPPQEAPVEDDYMEYEQPSKKAKVQSKVWH